MAVRRNVNGRHGVRFAGVRDVGALNLDPWNNLRGDRRVNSENAF